MKSRFSKLGVKQALAQSSIFAILLTLTFSAQALEVKGVKIDENAQVGSSTLVLNGAGLRTKMMFKVYAGALYLPQKQSDANAVINDHGNKRISMHFLRDVSSEQLLDGMNEGFADNNTQSEMTSIDAQLKIFQKMMVSAKEVKEGDVILLDCTTAGTQVSLNGRLLGKIDGELFNQALLRVWLGDHAVDTSLKKALLGQ
ncbi:chalcone isomerase family protein [Methylotenera versatilis]|uniref:Putative lipoprotein transmembrane n=1 Tax=Methylotenera versatilis (strain 301) TaxID=666681 RepID=D7DMI8_METV0|nr:chalcone isomerase family protein [Methylotenera versatilis]ADI30765.1 putative lipoprotein transmembrane [Methylotenera versatilis 301]